MQLPEDRHGDPCVCCSSINPAGAGVVSSALREIRAGAEAAGVSKPLLYHYFPSKVELFKAAISEKATELLELLSPAAQGDPMEQLTGILDAYLGWIDANARTWSKLMQSAASISQAGELLESFRQQTTAMILRQLLGDGKPRPALRAAIRGWLGYMDAAILDWIDNKDLTAHQLREHPGERVRCVPARRPTSRPEVKLAAAEATADDTDSERGRE